MALSWTPKASTEVREYQWAPLPDTAIDSASAVVTTGTATISATVSGDTVIWLVTGGTDGVVQVFTLTATAGEQTLTETAYLPIEVTTNLLGYTVRDVCDFALRKIVGVGVTSESAELDDALERLNDMVALWRVAGADMGLDQPLVEADALLIGDSEYLALKFNLRNALHEFYGHPLTQGEVMEARRALSAVMNNRRVHRAAEYY